MFFKRRSRSPEADVRLSDRDMERVLKRAIELDTQGSHSLARLREVAAELNISPNALDSALAELESPKAPAAVAARVVTEPEIDTTSGWRQWLTAAVVVVGTALGTIAGFDRAGGGGDDSTVVTVMMISALSVGLVWVHRRARKSWAMSAQMVALWASYGYTQIMALNSAGAVPEAARATDDTAALAITGALLSVGIGSMTTWVLRRWRNRAKRRSEKLSPPRPVTPLPDSFSTPI